MKKIDLKKCLNTTIVDKEPRQYLGLVSTTALDNHEAIFAAYMIGYGRGQCVLRRSNDLGASWSKRLDIPSSWSTLLQIPTLFHVHKPDGEQRLIMLTGHYPIRQSISDDNGQTWSELKAIGKFGGNVSMSSLLQLKSGRLLAFFHDDGRYLTKKDDLRYQLHRLRNGNDSQILFYRDSFIQISKKIGYQEFTRKFRGKQSKEGTSKKLVLDPSTLCTGQIEPKELPECIYASTAGKKTEGMNGKIFMCISDDAGSTWCAPTKIAEQPNNFLGEPGAFLSPKGNELSVIMLEHNLKKQSFLIKSADEGKTWTKINPVHSVLNGKRHVVKHLPDGRLIIVYGSRNDSIYSNEVVAWIGEYQTLVSGNDDFLLLRLIANKGTDFGYSGLEVLPDGTCIVTTYGSWDDENQRPYIISLKFNPLKIN